MNGITFLPGDVYAKAIPALIRSAPWWLVVTVCCLTVLAVASAGPLVGRAVIVARRRDLGRTFAGNGVFWDGSRWDETNAKATIAPYRDDPVIVIRDDRADRREKAYAQRLTYVAETVPIAPEEPATEPPASEETTEVEIIPQETKELPEWAKGGTSPLDILVYLDAELVEAESEAERQFHADPLGSWVLPPEVEEEFDFLPTADEAVSFLIRADLLTGEGMNVDAEWASWNLYEKEEAFA